MQQNVELYQEVYGIDLGNFGNLQLSIGDRSLFFILAVKAPIIQSGTQIISQMKIINAIALNGNAAVEPTPQAIVFKNDQTRNKITGKKNAEASMFKAQRLPPKYLQSFADQQPFAVPVKQQISKLIVLTDPLCSQQTPTIPKMIRQIERTKNQNPVPTQMHRKLFIAGGQNISLRMSFHCASREEFRLKSCIILRSFFTILLSKIITKRIIKITNKKALIIQIQ
eukprot:TRINITY_DN15243_c0_g1_i1.p2 TRINITY_DN15243_c0_g1~~TRINITY_DN15243_c0_g1_i1.p2  ORF type:complete len:225 (-),score=19.99 TRINITY_DN15243_c0_g1_i1:139-813(-)